MRTFALLVLLSRLATEAPDPAASASGRAQVEVAARRASALVAERVLDLALPGEDSLLVLSSEALTLYRLDGPRLRFVDREPLPPAAPVRAPAGMLLLADGGSSCWVLATGRERAFLFDVSANALEPRAEAAALPWPELPDGLRYAGGTHRLRAGVAEAPPLLRILPGSEAIAVDARGQLSVGGVDAGLTAGPTLAALWPATLATSLPVPPRASDEIVVLALDSTPPEIVVRIPVEGAVRALASRVEGRDIRLAAGLELAEGGFRILLLDLTQGHR